VTGLLPRGAATEARRIPGYQSRGARLLQEICARKPENIVWTPDAGWVDDHCREFPAYDPDATPVAAGRRIS
jgi:hypothetical protein